MFPKLTLTSSQGFDISDLLYFDPASMGLTALGAKVPSSQQSANLANQLQLIKGLLSAPISTLVDDLLALLKYPFYYTIRRGFGNFFGMIHVLTRH